MTLRATANSPLRFSEPQAHLQDKIRTLVRGYFISISRKEAVLFQRRILYAVLMLCAVVLSAPHGVRAQQSYAVITQNGVPMKTRDGVTLYSDIYRPKADGKFPVIVMRTPYDKSVGWAVGPAYQIATHGYVAVVQDVRGRYTSEGDWYPFRHESNDGYDTIEWAAALPSSNGKVGMTGRFLRRRNTDALRDCPSSASCGNLPCGHSQQLSRRLDVSGRSIRTVVRSKTGRRSSPRTRCGD